MCNPFNSSTFKINTNYVIEASAGTGKTYNIVDIVVQLVKKYNIDINKILIVTYTEKAASELKYRIGEKLTDVNLENASIGTIHSFCTNILKEFPISSSLPLTLELVDENYIDSYLQSYINNLPEIDIIIKEDIYNDVFNRMKAVYSKYFLDSAYSENREIVSLEYFDKDTYNKIINLAHGVIDNETKNYLKVLQDNVNSKYNKMIEALVNNNYLYFDGGKCRTSKKDAVEEQEAYNYFKKLKETYKEVKKLIVRNYIKDFYQKWQEKKRELKKQDFNDMIRYVREAVINEEGFADNIKSKYRYAIIDEFQDTNGLQYDIFSRLFLNDDHNIIVVGDPKQSIYAFQGADVHVYEKAKDEIGSKGGYIETLNKNYRSTKEMVESCNEMFKLYDLKYGFSDSDYLDKTKENAHEALYENEVPKAFWMVAKEEEGVNANEFIYQSVLQIVDFCTLDNKGNTRLRIKDKGVDYYRNVSFKDITFLVDKSANMKIVENQLRKYGIPFSRYKNKELFLRKECFDWIMLLEAINTLEFNGDNRYKFKKVLHTNFFGYSLSMIIDDLYNKDDCEEMRLVQKWKDLAFNRDWTALINDIILSSRLQENLSSLKTMQKLAIYKQIGNVCLDFLIKNNSLDALIIKLRNLYNKQGDDEDSGAIIEKGTDFDCVQIMTMHASKGLQFPVVIAFGGFSKGDKTDKAITYYDNSSLKKISFDTTKNEEDVIEEKKRLFYVAYTRAKYAMIIPKILSERGVPYKNYSFLFDANNKFYDEKTPFYTKVTYKGIVDKSSSDLIRKEVNKIIIKAKNINDTERDLSLKDKQEEVNKNLVKEKKNRISYKHSYSSLSHSNVTIVNNEISDEEIEDKEGSIIEGLSSFDTNGIYAKLDYNSCDSLLAPIGFPQGAVIGTALHEVFEKVDFKKQDNIDFVIDSRFKYYAIDNNPEWISYVKSMVVNVLAAKFVIVEGNAITNKSFKLNELDSSDRLYEVEFNFNLLDERLRNYCNGFIDLIIKRNNRFIILDWKSDKLNDNFTAYNDINELKKHVDEHYSIQRVLYSYCLMKWLKQQYEDLSYEEIFNLHFGGVYYVFIRGCLSNEYNGIYVHTWNSYKDLEESFNNIIKIKLRRGGNV